MHELSIALSLVDLASESAAQHEGRVVGVHIQLGALSGVVKEALLSAWELARAGTRLADAKLVIEEVPIAARCARCDALHTYESIQRLACPQCGEPLREIIGGRELDLVALEMST
jgi:hydrogenase nickel incorporation protein HypA/HybF